MKNPHPDESLNDFNESLAEIETSQNDLNHALSQLTAEVGPLSANASCEEISQFNVTEDGYYMIQPSLELPPFKARCKFNKIINKAYTILEPEHSQSNFITGEDSVPILTVPIATWLCSFHIRDLSYAE